MLWTQGQGVEVKGPGPPFLPSSATRFCTKFGLGQWWDSGSPVVSFSGVFCETETRRKFDSVLGQELATTWLSLGPSQKGANLRVVNLGSHP